MPALNQPTSRDLAAWRRLLDRVGAASADARAPVGDLAVSLKATRRAVLPCLPHTAANPFARLHKLASRFALETARGRLDLLGGMQALHGECAALLDRPGTPPPHSPSPRRRADLDD